MTLLEAISQVPDFRRAQGTRHPVTCVLVGVLLSTLSGYRTWRPHAEFIQRHYAELAAALGLERPKPPSYSTLRRVVKGIDFTALSHAFLAWARQHVPIEEGEWLAIDGKSLRGSVSEANEAAQNFTALVSLYSHKRGLVLESRAFENKEQSEAHVVEALLAEATLEGAGVTLDALHCRKKLAASSEPPGRTT